MEGYLCKYAIIKPNARQNRSSHPIGALYSRAGCLILDDIFSAVDAHVGRHLFENALTGELGEGRTRILVTHHVGLVVSRARYMVIMENGTVTSAGSINEMKNSGTLEQILKEDRNEHESEEHTALNPGDTEEEDALKKVTSRAEEAKIDDGGIETKTGTKPKKFVEDEKREVRDDLPRYMMIED